MLRLIEQAPAVGELPVDAELRLRAQQSHRKRIAEIFDEDDWRHFSFSVEFQRGLRTEALLDVSGNAFTRTYSTDWLEGTLDFPSILNNFQLLFEFTDLGGLLALPAYKADLSPIMAAVGYRGVREYQSGAAFDLTESMSLLETHSYSRYLRSHGIELEDVVSWFASEYLPEEFGAQGFCFNPSTPGASDLERARHLFAELESLARQFRTYQKRGSVEAEYLALDSTEVVFGALPSLAPKEYVVAARDCEVISGLLHVLFSDQSRLTHIDAERRDRSLAGLLVAHDLQLDDFHEFQRPAVEKLLEMGVLTVSGGYLRFKDPAQLHVLAQLFYREAVSYHRLPGSAQRSVDEMLSKGWLESRSSLLTEPEAAYFNFILNRKQFSGGPALRNKLLHGQQGPEGHETAYLIALRTLIALVIKINDDFRVAHELGGEMGTT